MSSYVQLASLGPGQLIVPSLPGGGLTVLQSRPIDVFLRDTSTPATVYPNPDGTGTPLTQPISTDNNGNLPGYVLSGVAVDLYDTITGARVHPETLASLDVIGSDGKIGGTGSRGLPVAVVTASSFPPGAAFYDVVGHSIPGGGGVTNGDWNGYVDKLMFLLGSPRRRRNLAIGGSVSCLPSNQNQTGDGGWGHAFQYLLPPALGAGSGPYLPQSDLSVAHAALNDLAILGVANPTPMQEAHRAIISRMVASAVAQVTDAAWTFTGTWSALTALGQTSPAGLKWTSTLNDTASLAVPSDYPGGRTVAVNLIVNPAHDLTLGVTIDGVAQPDVRLQGSVLCSPNGYNAAGTAKDNAKCLRYTVAAAGAHTIVLRLKTQTIGGSTMYIDSAHIESDPADGPLVLVPNPHRCVNYTLWGASWPNGASMSDANVLTWQTALASVAAEFGHTLVVDVDTALNKTASLFSSDGAHPNDAGHGVIAKTIFDALLASGKMLSRQFSRVSPLLSAPFWIPVQPQSGTGAINSYPAFQNSWVNFGSPSSAAAFYKDTAGRVHIKGRVKSGSSASATIFTLPAGYRPSEVRQFAACAAAGALAQIQVDTSGNVSAVNGGSTTSTWLEGVNFIAEQ